MSLIPAIILGSFIGFIAGMFTLALLVAGSRPSPLPKKGRVL